MRSWKLIQFACKQSETLHERFFFHFFSFNNTRMKITRSVGGNLEIWLVFVYFTLFFNVSSVAALNMKIIFRHEWVRYVLTSNIRKTLTFKILHICVFTTCRLLSKIFPSNNKFWLISSNIINFLDLNSLRHNNCMKLNSQFKLKLKWKSKKTSMTHRRKSILHIRNRSRMKENLSTRTSSVVCIIWYLEKRFKHFFYA